MKRWIAIALGPAMGIAAILSVIWVRTRSQRNQNDVYTGRGGNQANPIDEPRSYNMDWYSQAYPKTARQAESRRRKRRN